MTNTTKVIVVSAIVLLLLTANIKEVSGKALAIIKSFEGEKLTAYQDEAGIWTIGWGSTYNHDLKRRVQKGDVIDKETALRWLRLDAANAAANVKKVVKVPINQNQLDSLTSFSYNIGDGAFASSTLLRKLNAGSSIQEIALEFAKWNKVTKNGEKVVSNGLVRRRKMEADLFLS
jgi:lysozyme